MVCVAVENSDHGRLPDQVLQAGQVCRRHPIEEFDAHVHRWMVREDHRRYTNLKLPRQPSEHFGNQRVFVGSPSAPIEREKPDAALLPSVVE